MILSLTKTVVVVVSSTILATLAVNALDMNGVFSRTMLGSVFNFSVETTSECPTNMVLVTQALTPFCLDAYEASPSSECVYSEPTSGDETLVNISSSDCRAVSKAKKLPWRHITVEQAQQACSRAGKRLPTAREWYKGSLGTPDINSGWTEEHCNVAGNRADVADVSGGGMRCISDAGAYDMVGNVWEWVAETVDHGKWNDRTLPDTGFVQGVDVDGIAFETQSAKNSIFQSDRFWSDASIVAGMMRGGYYNSAGQAGIFATYTASPPTFNGSAVGFRCAVSRI